MGPCEVADMARHLLDNRINGNHSYVRQELRKLPLADCVAVVASMLARARTDREEFDRLCDFLHML